MVIIETHDPGWRDEGLALAAELSAALGPAALRVEHIGSTAIPGMDAKPIFDFQVSVDSLEAAERLFAVPLAALGFTASPYRQDHVPAGCDDPPSLWVKRLWTRRGAGRREVNLHVRLAGSPNERLALVFRDWFRAHPEAVPAYSRFKHVLAAAVPNTGVYADVKDPVVDLIVTIATHRRV